MPAFDYRQAEEIRDTFARHSVRYLFIGKSGAVLLGFPDTTQDADVFVARSPENGRALVVALRELGFQQRKNNAGSYPDFQPAVTWCPQSKVCVATL